ncbi:hypothetical protein [Roseomonas chloroacetimidivorans]|uniref:hypothetical protein n=1 Tax=Roseomonas chloroacetimidivorans TaxID=1766656 RepID=UPI003C78A2F9
MTQPLTPTPQPGEMREADEDKRAYCDVFVTEKGGDDLKPCDGLQSVLSSGSLSSAGAHIATTVNRKTGVMHRRLVIQPLKKDGNGLFANFCPICGTALTGEHALSFVEGRAALARASAPQGGV